MTPLARAISSHLLGGSFPTGWGPVNDRLLSTFQDIKDIVFFFFFLGGECDPHSESGPAAGAFNSLPAPGAGVSGLIG